MTKKADLPPFRPCDLCGGVDQDPRHSFAGLVGATDNAVFDPLADIRPVLEENLADSLKNNKLSTTEVFAIKQAFEDTSSTDRHIDCCADAGCPTDTCGAIADKANGKTGEGMRSAALSMSKGN